MTLRLAAAICCRLFDDLEKNGASDMITEHKNAGSETLSCRLSPEDRQRLGDEIDIAGLDVERIARDVETLNERLKERKKDLDSKKDEVFDKIATRNAGAESRSVVFDEIHDHDQQRVFKRRQDTGAVFDYRNMTDVEAKAAPGQLDIDGEPELPEPQDVVEIAAMIHAYLDAFPPDEPEGAAPDAEAGVEPPPEAGDTPEPADPTSPMPSTSTPSSPKTRSTDTRLDDQRAEILSFDGDLDGAEKVQKVLCALGYWMPLDDVFRLDETEGDWIYRRRAAWQADRDQREPVAITERPEAIPAPSDAALEIQTDEDLVVSLIRCGYFLPPTDLAELTLQGWEELRHYAAAAPAFDINQPAPQEPETLDDVAIDQVENLGALLFVLGYQILDDSGQELEAFDPADDQLNALVSWCAQAFSRPADPDIKPPEFLEPFQIEPESPPDPSAAFDIVEMAPAALETYLAELQADKKDGLKELRTLAQELAGDSVDPGFYDNKARKTCVRAILAVVEEQREAAAKAPWDEPEDLDLDTSDLEPSP